MCQSLVGWQLALLVPETGRKPVPPSLGREMVEGPSVPSQALLCPPPAKEGGSWQKEGGREGPGSPTQGFLELGFAQGEEFALGLLPLF